MTVGILGCGEMGAGIGRALTAAGHTVLTVLEGRSPETTARAAEAGMTAADDLADLVARSAIVFSILPPSAAEAAGRELASVAGDARGLVFVEANAISPDLARTIAASFAGTVTVLDAGIIGMPPSGEARPRLYYSGPRCAVLEQLGSAAFDARYLGPEIGAASGMKMAYAAVTKGTNALLTAGFLLAEEMGLGDAYAAELSSSQPDMFKRADKNIARLPADAGRWVREMEEIRDTFAAHGLPGGFHDAAAEVMALLDASRFGNETRRTIDRTRTMRETVQAITSDRARPAERHTLRKAEG